MGLGVCAGDIAIAPRRPETVHGPSIRAGQRVAAIGADRSGAGSSPEKQIIFAAMVPKGTVSIQSSYESKKIQAAGMTW
jgi:hypothetical protein